MRLIYLKEGRNYSTRDLEACVKNQLEGDCAWVDSAFLERLRDSINTEFEKSVVKGTRSGSGTEGRFVFHYLGLYDYTDKESGRNLTFFFVPKFIDFREDTDCGYDEDCEGGSVVKNADLRGADNRRVEQFSERERNAVLLAIDRYNRKQSSLAEQVEGSEKQRESLLELVVRMLRDYLENGIYTVQRHELERNGQGEIDWNTTIDLFQPSIIRGRPYYMDVMTEQAYSDEDYYITRLHKCLITRWGIKLEKLGLSSVLRVNVSPLSEEELDHFGDADYQIAQINKELNVQFVTKARETLVLLKELIQRSSENQASCHESLSFGMNGVEHLWETSCAEVLGSDLEKKISDCGFEVGQDCTFRKYMPSVFWKNLEPGENKTKEFGLDEGSQRSKKAGWRLDFIRVWKGEGGEKKLVILDAKYYCVRWKDGSVSGQPGTPDIAKQMFYQMVFEGVIDRKHIVNAFLIPEDDECGDEGIRKAEIVELGWKQSGKETIEAPPAFAGINLFTVRIPGIRLLERYGNYELAEDWFEKIVSWANDNDKNTDS